MSTKLAYIQIIVRYKILSWSVAINLVAACVTLSLLLTTSQTINGINIWIKPTKFLLTAAIYLLTIPFYLSLLPYAMGKKIRFATAFAIIMVLENVAIVMQAARGVMSHYNISSAFNAQVFEAMGITIFINTILLFLLFVDFLKIKNHPQKPFVIACRYALFLIFLAAIGGGIMAAQLHHSIGAADNAPGMPITNWNRLGGDLRVMHFFGIHALQLLPIIVWAAGNKKSFFTNHLPGLLILILVVYTFLTAMQGKPFLG